MRGLPGAPFSLSGLASAVFLVTILASQSLPLEWAILAGIAVSQVMRLWAARRD